MESSLLSKEDDDNLPGRIQTLPRSEGRLDCGVTKGRVKGPPGRRLPKKSQKVFPMETKTEFQYLELMDDKVGFSNNDNDDTKLDASLSPEAARMKNRRMGHAISLSSLDFSVEYVPGGSRDNLKISTSREHTNPLSFSVSAQSSESLHRLSFEKAWFLKLPGSNDYQSITERLDYIDDTPEYLSLNESHTNSAGSSIPTDSEKAQVNSNSSTQEAPVNSFKSESRPNSGKSRYFCYLL